MKTTINKQIGKANENALQFDVIVTQKSTNVRNGVKLHSNFKGTFSVHCNRYLTMGQSLNRILKGLNYQIVQGKKSGKLNGLSLRHEFKFEISYNGELLFASEKNEFNAKCGLTENSQNRFFKNFANQYAKAFNEKTDFYLNFTNEDSSNYTLEDDSQNFRELMNMNVVDSMGIYF